MLGAIATSGCFTADPLVPEDTDGAASTGSPGTGGSSAATLSTSVSASGVTGDDASSGDVDDDDDDSTSTTDPTQTSTLDPDSSTTSPPQDCDARDGELDATCPDDAPFCNAGSCVGCDGLATDPCPGVDPATPVCDPESGTCTTCSAHDQCESGACRYETGECFGTTNQLWVDAVAACASATGQEDAPFCTVTEAVQVVNGQAANEPWVIHLAGAASPYEGGLSPESGKPLALIGPASGLEARIDATAGDNITIFGGGEFYASDIVLSQDGSGDTLACSNGSIWFERGAVEGSNFNTNVDLGACTAVFRNTSVTNHEMGLDLSSVAVVTLDGVEITNGSGAMITAGDITIERSYIHDAYVAGGIDVTGGTLTMRNSYVVQNGYNIGNVFVRDGGQIDIAYSTLMERGFDCAPSAAGVVRNSIVNSFDSTQCGSVTVSNSAVLPSAGGLPSGSNVQFESEDLAAMFMLTGDLRYQLLAAPALVADLAVWRDGDPPQDHDGDPRPTENESPDFAGADVP